MVTVLFMPFVGTAGALQSSWPYSKPYSASALIRKKLETMFRKQKYANKYGAD